MCKLVANYPRILPVAFAVLFLLLSAHYSQGRRFCYSCSAHSESENSTDCIDNPHNITDAAARVRCKHSCIVKRVEYIYHIPVIFAITRFCDKANVTNEVTIDDYYITYFRSCKSNLCNDGDGLENFPENHNETDEMEESNVSQNLLPRSYFTYLYYSFGSTLLACFLFGNAYFPYFHASLC